MLAKATFADETASGWQTVDFDPPVPVSPKTTYIASYHTEAGHYAQDVSYFSGKNVGSGPLHALADGADGGNGIYIHGTGGFPNQTSGASNYWVDVAFTTAAAFEPWLRMMDLFALRDGLPAGEQAIDEVFTGARTAGVSQAELLHRLSQQTRWNEGDLSHLVGDQGLQLPFPGAFRDERALTRLVECFDTLKRLGMSAQLCCGLARLDTASDPTVRRRSARGGAGRSCRRSGRSTMRRSGSTWPSPCATCCGNDSAPPWWPIWRPT